jgi:hypothetical protein
VRSSHMNVGPEVQAVTIRRQVPPNQCLHATANLTRRPSLRAPISLSPCASPSRRLHAAREPHVGHQISASTSYLGQGCPTRAARSGSAMLVRIEQSLFTAVPLLASEHVPLRAEWVMASFDARSPATSSAARVAAPVIVAATRAERPHQRLQCGANVDPQCAGSSCAGRWTSQATEPRRVSGGPIPVCSLCRLRFGDSGPSASCHAGQATGRQSWGTGAVPS